MSVIGYVDPKDLPAFLARVESLDNQKVRAVGGGGRGSLAGMRHSD
jgi:hypothetical protein